MPPSSILTGKFAHWAEGGRIRAEVTVERGRGYVPADSHSHYKQAIDVLPIDAVFMPVRKVSYNVEPTRVGESTDFDKLTIEIWSNGSIDATEAISQAARQVIEHLLPIAELSGKPMVPPLRLRRQTASIHRSQLKSSNFQFALTTASSEPISTR